MLARRILWNLVGLAAAIWLLCCLTQSGKLLVARWEVPEHVLPGTPVRCHLRIRSWLKPTLHPRVKFGEPTENLTLAHAAEVHWTGLHPLGLVWQQSVTFIPLGHGEIRSMPVDIGIHSLTLPSFTIENPPDDVVPQLATPSSKEPPSMKTFIPVCFIGLFIFCAILHTVIARHLKQSPLYRLRKLTCTPGALDQLPDILKMADITPQTHPDFFKRLSTTRFGGTHPDEETIHSLIHDAELLILQ